MIEQLGKVCHARNGKAEGFHVSQRHKKPGQQVRLVETPAKLKDNPDARTVSGKGNSGGQS